MIEGKIIANFCIEKEANVSNKDFDDFVKEIKDHINQFGKEKYELVVDNDVNFGANITVIKKKKPSVTRPESYYAAKSVSTNTKDMDYDM